MKRFRMLIFLLFFSNYNNQLKAILDGRTGNFPIDIDVPYTFSNFEWARGYVILEKGFDLPPGGTIFLGIDQTVNGTINLNGGTIILEKGISLRKDVVFTDSGFFKTNNHTIFLSGELNLTNTYYFSDRITFNGMGTGIINAFPSSKIISRNYNRINLKLLTMNMLGETSNFIFTTTGDRWFILDNTSLRTTGTILIEDFQTIGRSSLNGHNALFIGSRLIRNNIGTLSVNFGTRLETRAFVVNAKFDTTNLDSVQLCMKNSGWFLFPGLGGQGNLIIDGKCSIDSKNTTTIVAQSTINIILKSNARLSIEPNTYLRIL